MINVVFFFVCLKNTKFAFERMKAILDVWLKRNFFCGNYSLSCLVMLAVDQVKELINKTQ